MTSFLGPLRQTHLQGKAVPSKNYFRLRFGIANEWACHRFRVFFHTFGQCAQRRFDGGGCDGKGPLFVLYPGASTERGRHLLPQSHNFRLDFGWIAEDAFKEVRIDGIEAVAETDDGRGDV